jgi:FkbM family methyltransferase
MGLLRRIENYYRQRLENQYRLAGFRFVYTSRLNISTYVHPEKLIDIIQTNSACDAEPMMEALSSKIDKLGIVLDVGANIGIVSAWLAKRSAFVYSFEPDPSNAELMKKNFELNAISNARICMCAAGKDSGQADFYVRNAFGHHGLQSKHISKTAEIRKVAVVSLDEFCHQNKIPEVSLLKLDIEGGELDALIGFKNFLASKKVKMIVFEHAPILLENDSKSRLSVFNYLTDFGYSIYNLDHRVVSEKEMDEAPQGDFYAVAF